MGKRVSFSSSGGEIFALSFQASPSFHPWADREAWGGLLSGTGW
jgi:hypothetical protein